MEATTPGIVLRKVAYTGSSMVVSIYTRRFGQLAFMARSVGRKKATSHASIQPLSRVEVTCTFRENKQLQTLRGLRPLTDAPFGAGGPEKAAVSMFLAEVLYKSLREEAPDEDLFDFVNEAVSYFGREAFQANFHLTFLMHLTRYFGFFPSGNWEAATPCFDLTDGCFARRPADARPILEGTRAQHFYALSQMAFGDAGRTWSNAARRDLLHDLLSYYGLHLEGMGKIHSLEVLSEVFS